jgi:hypothetical protein
MPVRSALLAVLLTIGLVRAALACPPSCAPYDTYLIIVASGPDKAEVELRARAIAEKLGAMYVGEDDPSGQSKCADKENCLVLLAIKSPSPGGKGRAKLVYAAAIPVNDGFRSAERKAAATLERVRKVVTDAYRKPVPQCACE